MTEKQVEHICDMLELYFCVANAPGRIGGGFVRPGGAVVCVFMPAPHVRQWEILEASKGLWCFDNLSVEFCKGLAILEVKP